MLSADTAQRPALVASIRYGMLAGVVAGIAFAVFEMIAAALLDGPAAFFMPLRMIGGIALGPTAIEPATSLLVAGGAGIVVHMVLSMMYGVASAAAIALVPQLAASRTNVVLAASVAGLGLWIVNFYVLAPLLGWVWFPNGTILVVQVVAHVLFFGAVLGLVLDQAWLARRRASGR